MRYTGVVHGRTIELDEPLPFEEGTRVEVAVTPQEAPRPGSPAAVLQLVGTLTPAEARELREATLQLRQVDGRLWEDPPA